MFKCTYPVELNRNGLQTFVNCKTCTPCYLRRQNEWMTKLWLEHWATENVLGRSSSAFLTFTYSDDCLPTSAQHLKEDLQRFWKRLRNTGSKIRYFYIGERGPNTGRLHAHALLFGWDVNQKSPIWWNSKSQSVHYVEEPLQACWRTERSGKMMQSGRLLSAPITHKSIRYLARYGLKEKKRGEVVLRGGSNRPGLGYEGAKLLRETLDKQGLDQEQVICLLRRNTKGRPVPMFMDYNLRKIANIEFGHLKGLDEAAVESSVFKTLGPPDMPARIASAVQADKVMRRLHESY